MPGSSLQRRNAAHKRSLAATIRATALLVVAGLAGGCDARGNPDPTLVEVAIVTAPIWVPALAIYCVAENCGSGGRNAAGSADAKAMRAAAEKGDPRAQYELGARYEAGYEGVADYETEAARWYRKSAEGGYADARLALGEMYEQGRGVERDNVQADMWYAIALSTFDAEGATTKSESAAQRRDSIEQRMPPEEIAEARKRAEEWKPKTQ